MLIISLTSFIYSWKYRFSDIFWIDASSEGTIDLRLRQIAKAYNVPGTVSADSTLKWLATQKKWLVVYDNADGGYEVIEKFLPPGSGGSVLITSRNQAMKRITLGNSIEVHEMDEEEAISLLSKSAMFDNSSEETRTLASSIVSEVGYIPLAIDQAGAYIQVTDCDLGHYLDLYKKHHDQLMSNATFKGASDYGFSTYGTWEISMQEIERRASVDAGPEGIAAKSAVVLHKIFAFLHHDNISEEIFQRAAENYITRNIEEEEKSGFLLSVTLLNPEVLFLNGEGEWDKLHFLAGIQVLVSFSLIKNTNKLYSIHPLVHAWSRHRIPKPYIHTIHTVTRAMLACSIDPDYEDDNHAFCTLLVPHIKESNTHITQLKLKKMNYIDECVRFAFVFDRVADWNETEKLEMYVVQARKAKLGAYHPDTLDSMANLAATYMNQGKWDKAEKVE
ncbi:hypothetical protein AX15_007476, partial [Amanita polypyramis BW_CC]